MKDKLYFIYTGQTPLQHPDELDLIDQMLEDAEKLYKYKPVMLAMGVETLLTKVPTPLVKELKDLLPKANCRRSAQVIYNYDNVFKVCKDKITTHQIEEVPLLFDSLEIDREAIVFYNMNETEVSECFSTGSKNYACIGWAFLNLWIQESGLSRMGQGWIKKLENV